MLKFKVADQVKIFFGIGVTTSVGLFSNYSDKTDGKWQKQKMDNDYNSDSWGGRKRFDFGAQGFVGLQAFRFTLTVNYNNSFISTSDIFVEKYRVLSVNIGYRIRDKEKKPK